MNFDEAFDFVMELEGGFKLHTNPTEETETYAGIYRAAHPNWEGWVYIDKGELPHAAIVKGFYKEHFWDIIPVDDVLVKAMLFEFGVNAGMGAAIRVLQSSVGAEPDGAIGPKTKKAIEKHDKSALIAEFSIQRVQKYVTLTNQNSSKYGIYLRGWMNRTLQAYTWFKENAA
jgi:lysozyme family protein